MNINKIRSVWAEVDLDIIAENMREIRRITKPSAEIIAVIKANAYGHGAAEIADVLLRNGADRFAVAVLDEAVKLRSCGINAPILILGYTSPERAATIVDGDIATCVYHYNDALALSDEAVKQQKTVKLHIKIDSGMGRIGYQPNEESIKEICRIAALPNVLIEGVFTHFCTADSKDKSFTNKQYESFDWVCSRLREESIKIKFCHCANSAAILELLPYHYDMVRAGIILYGMAPSDEVDITKTNLRPAMTLKCKVTHVKEIVAGDSVSYGRKFIANSTRVIASLPLGYADGYTRLLSCKAKVLIHGRRVPVVGNICMDQCMIDVTGIADVQVGDEVVLFGQQDSSEVTVEELAGLLGTINYEIVCMLSDRIPRVYIQNGEIVNIVYF